MNDAIAKAVAKATRAAIQTMVESHQGEEDQRPRVGSLALKQLQFNWDALISTQNQRHSSWR